MSGIIYVTMWLQKFDHITGYHDHDHCHSNGWVSMSGHQKVWRFNSLGPSDTIWWQTYGSTSDQVMACCLKAPSHYLNQCWLIISKAEWHSSKGKFTRDTSAINHWNYLENQAPKISFQFPGGQWVNIKPVWGCLPLQSSLIVPAASLCGSSSANDAVAIGW